MKAKTRLGKVGRSSECTLPLLPETKILGIFARMVLSGATESMGTMADAPSTEDLRKLARVVRGRAEGRLLERADVIDYLVRVGQSQDLALRAVFEACVRDLSEGKHAK